MWEGRMGPPLPEGKGNTDRARREEAKRISLSMRELEPEVVAEEVEATEE